MMFRLFRYLLLCVIPAFSGCRHSSFAESKDADLISINRFDSTLYQWIETDDTLLLQAIEKEYPQMLEALNSALFRANISDSQDKYERLINYFSEPALKSLYRDALSRYSADSATTRRVVEELSLGFGRMQAMIASMQLPAFYFHVSGLQQNIIVADSLLSCSIDKYLGADYPFYTDYFHDYQRRRMSPDNIAQDCLAAWLRSEFPFRGQNNVLLERMVYEGQILYALTRIGEHYTFRTLTSMTEVEYRWCLEYEQALWTAIIERKHLYTPDIATTSKYLLPSPATFISTDAPGYIGQFMGFRIVERFIKQTGLTCGEMLETTDAQEILTKSKYKP
jgi:hypothetical protein